MSPKEMRRRRRKAGKTIKGFAGGGLSAPGFKPYPAQRPGGATAGAANNSYFTKPENQYAPTMGTAYNQNIPFSNQSNYVTGGNWETSYQNPYAGNLAGLGGRIAGSPVSSGVRSTLSSGGMSDLGRMTNDEFLRTGGYTGAMADAAKQEGAMAFRDMSDQIAQAMAFSGGLDSSARTGQMFRGATDVASKIGIEGLRESVAAQARRQEAIRSDIAAKGVQMQAAGTLGGLEQSGYANAIDAYSRAGGLHQGAAGIRQQGTAQQAGAGQDYLNSLLRQMAPGVGGGGGGSSLGSANPLTGGGGRLPKPQGGRLPVWSSRTGALIQAGTGQYAHMNAPTRPGFQRGYALGGSVGYTDPQGFNQFLQSFGADVMQGWKGSESLSTTDQRTREEVYRNQALAALGGMDMAKHFFANRDALNRMTNEGQRSLQQGRFGVGVILPRNAAQYAAYNIGREYAPADIQGMNIGSKDREKYGIAQDAFIGTQSDLEKAMGNYIGGPTPQAVSRALLMNQDQGFSPQPQTLWDLRPSQRQEFLAANRGAMSGGRGSQAGMGFDEGGTVQGYPYGGTTYNPTVEAWRRMLGISQIPDPFQYTAWEQAGGSPMGYNMPPNLGEMGYHQPTLDDFQYWGGRVPPPTGPQPSISGPDDQLIAVETGETILPRDLSMQMRDGQMSDAQAGALAKMYANSPGGEDVEIGGVPGGMPMTERNKLRTQMYQNMDPLMSSALHSARMLEILNKGTDPMGSQLNPQRQVLRQQYQTALANALPSIAQMEATQAQIMTDAITRDRIDAHAADTARRDDKRLALEQERLDLYKQSQEPDALEKARSILLNPESDPESDEWQRASALILKAGNNSRDIVAVVNAARQALANKELDPEAKVQFLTQLGFIAERVPGLLWMQDKVKIKGYQSPNEANTSAGALGMTQDEMDEYLTRWLRQQIDDQLAQSR